MSSIKPPSDGCHSRERQLMFTMAMFNRLPVELGRMRMIFHELDTFL